MKPIRASRVNRIRLQIADDNISRLKASKRDIGRAADIRVVSDDTNSARGAVARLYKGLRRTIATIHPYPEACEP